MNRGKYNAGAYIRLSREDEDKNVESESIKNQKSLIYQYAKENNFSIEKTYIDDGYSGTNFDRPEFKRMINDIESKKINMIITKDMSRLGRDYIGTGSLIEKYFPERNVRYIAITDNIDTFIDNTNNDIAPFKAIMNDMYAKDISKKIKSSLRAKQKEGKWVGGRPPYGYDKNNHDKNHLVINIEKSEIVKRIYMMFLDNYSIANIADALTKENIPVPSFSYNKINSNVWNSKTIRDILTNRTYTGDLVQNKRNKVNYKIKKIINNNPKDYIIVENTHEPIITREMFNEVQRKLPKSKGRRDKKENNLLDGLLYCGECGHRIMIMPRRKRDNNHYTICNYYRTNIKLGLCTMHSNNYDKLEKEVIDVLLSKLKKQINIEYIDKKLDKVVKKSIDNKRIENDKILFEINKINNQLDELYIDKLNKRINYEQYERIRTKLEENLYLKEEQYKKTCSVNNTIKYNNVVYRYINNILKHKKISRKLIINLIERIDIHEDKTIDIKVHFKKIV